MLAELYSDQRYHGYQGPSRSVSHPRACSVGGGTFAMNQDGSRCVIAGKDVLRILRIHDPPLSQPSSGLPSRVQSQSNLALGVAGTRVSTGPGGTTIEAGSNLWSASGLKMESAPTDVVWGRGNFDNKIVTSARNGEIIHWDVNRLGSKCESRIKEHKRAINQLAISPFLPYLLVSGSQDGYLRVWDLRTPQASTMKVYHPTGIRALALCPVPSNPLTVCTGLESGNIQRWDIRNKASPLERITLAHSASVLSMDWQLPNTMREAGLGWIATSGMDRHVKIWDLCLSPGTTIPANANERDALLLGKRMGPRPLRTLHTAFPVRTVRWRPGYDCEVAVASNNESESETVEIWDVRRGWIAKWALEGTEGGITDIAFASSHTLWAQHTNGTFAQCDLRESFRPLDAVPRVAMSWTASGDLAFVAHKQPVVEIPFDDVDPLKKSIFHELRLRPKATSDPMYIPWQTPGMYHVPLFDQSAFVRLAKSYIFEGDKLWVCQTNAELASQMGQYPAAWTWLLALSQLTELRAPSPPRSVSPLALPSAVRPVYSPAAQSAASISASEPRTSSRRTSARNLIDGRSEASVPVPSEHGHPTYGQDTPPSSSSSSPGPRGLTMKTETGQPRTQWLDAPRGSQYDQSKASPRSFRRASTALPATPRQSRPQLRRATIVAGSSPGSEGVKAHKHAHVGEGALDDSESDSGSDSDGTTVSESGGGKVVTTTTTPESNPRPAKRGPKVVPSPLSKLVVSSREDSPDGHLASDERSLSENDSDVTHSSDATHSPRSSSSSSSLHSESSSRKRRAAGRGSWSPQPAEVHRGLAKQESQSSIRTVTAPPSDPQSSRIRALPEDDTRFGAAINEGILNRRPSVVSGLGLGLTNMDEQRDGVQNAQHGHVSQNTSRLSERHKRQIRAAEARLRDIGWRTLRDALEWFADNGDVQMCALLAMVVPSELGIGESRAVRFVEAYVDLLARMQLHTAAAHIRKYARYAAVRKDTQVQTTVYSSCGRCRKPMKSGGSAGAGITECAECRARPSLCAVCHLPARTLLLHCAICGHGAHVACLRAFYLARPLTLISTHPLTAPPPPGTAHPFRVQEDSSSSTGSISTGYYSFSEETEGEEEESMPRKFKDQPAEEDGAEALAERMRVLGHACAAGCGHYCWAAAKPP